MYYVDVDTRQNRIYIAPFLVDKKKPWLIWCDNRQEAHEIMKKLTAKLISPPPKSKNFKLVETYKDQKLGEVDIYSPVLTI